MRRLLLGALVLAVAILGPMAPAGAAGASGSVTGINGVLYDDCLAYPYQYQVTVPEGSGYWDLTTRLVGPDGRQTASDYVAEPVSGRSTFGLLCPPADTYGSYTIHASVRWGADPDSLGAPVSLADAHFTLRKPRTRTGLTVSTRRPAYGQTVTYRIRAFDERPSGYLPTAFTWVHLEKRRDGHWVRITGGRAMTHSTGRVKVRLQYLKHHQRMRVRAVTERTPRLARSVSPVVRLW